MTIPYIVFLLWFGLCVIGSAAAWNNAALVRREKVVMLLLVWAVPGVGALLALWLYFRNGNGNHITDMPDAVPLPRDDAD